MIELLAYTIGYFVLLLIAGMWIKRKILGTPQSFDVMCSGCQEVVTPRLVFNKSTSRHDRFCPNCDQPIAGNPAPRLNAQYCNGCHDYTPRRPDGSCKDCGYQDITERVL